MAKSGGMSGGKNCPMGGMTKDMSRGKDMGMTGAASGGKKTKKKGK